MSNGKERKVDKFYTRPDDDSIETIKEWFGDMCKAMGIEDEVTDEDAREIRDAIIKAKEKKKRIVSV